jgi:uncharacterized protein DUF3891
MIVRPARNGVHLVSQPNHAALSRRIMEHWQLLHESSRRDSILLAIGEHDNGWREADANPEIDETGHIVDFVAAPAGVKQSVWPRGIARLAADPYAAALVAQHAITVYDRYRRDHEWDAFFLEMETSRDHLLRIAQIRREELFRDYAFVRLGDLLSLTFCTGWHDEQAYDRWRVRLVDDMAVTVTPFELDASQLAIEVSAREIPAERFASHEEFQSALSSARSVTLRGRLVNS